MRGEERMMLNDEEMEMVRLWMRDGDGMEDDKWFELDMKVYELRLRMGIEKWDELMDDE